MVQILITADTGSGSKDQYLVAESMQNLLKNIIRLMIYFY